MSRENYRVQNGCHNCKYVFIYFEIDENDHYFCNIDNNRPIPCGSLSMEEEFCRNDKAVGRQEMRSWDNWAYANEIIHSGICDKYERI